MPDARRRLFVVFLAGVVVTQAAVQLGRAFFHPKQGLDFASPYLAGKLLLRGDHRFYDDAVVGAAGAALRMHGPAGPGDPVLPFQYPPWVPVAYAPFALLPWLAARVAWFVLSVAATLLALRLLSKAIARHPDEERTLTVGAFAGAAFFFPLVYSLMTGQVNAVLLLLLAASLLLFRRGRGFLAGLLLAPAALCKPFLAFPVLVFLARRAWGALAGFVAGAVSLGLLGVVAAGPGGWSLWWAKISVYNAVTRFEWRNNGLAAAALALFSPGGGTEPIVSAPSLAAPFLVAAGALASALALLAILPTRMGGERPELGFGAALALGLLLTPNAWEHYGLFLIPAFLAVFAALGETDEEHRRLPLALLGASFAIWAFTLLTREEYAALARRPLSALLPVKTYATLLLLGLSAWAARERGRSGSP
jgi:hypothetical protein